MRKQQQRFSMKKAIYNLVVLNQDIVPILPEIDQMNLHRMYLMSVLGMLLSASHVILFAFFTITTSSVEAYWRLGVLLTHSVLLGIQALIFGITTYVRIKNLKPSRRFIHMLVSLAILSIILAGIILVSLDQLVTTAITPFLVICIFVAMIFTIQPIVSIPLFLCTYLAFYFLIGLYQFNIAILLSNRVNGITSVVIGIFLSLSIWRGNTRNLLQKQFIAKQQQELEEKNAMLSHLATVDGLTGLLNRRELDTSLSNVLDDCNLTNRPLSLILLDIDYFKAYNDLYGHLHGDECLRSVARLLEQSVRSAGDLVARFGGEEFVIIMPNASNQEAKALAENIRAAIVALAIRHEGNPLLQVVSASFGVLTVRPPTSLNTAQILNEVDALMYAAKTRGRNLVVSS